MKHKSLQKSCFRTEVKQDKPKTKAKMKIGNKNKKKGKKKKNFANDESEHQVCL